MKQWLRISLLISIFPQTILQALVVVPASSSNERQYDNCCASVACLGRGALAGMIGPWDNVEIEYIRYKIPWFRTIGTSKIKEFVAGIKALHVALATLPAQPVDPSVDPSKEASRAKILGYKGQASTAMYTAVWIITGALCSLINVPKESGSLPVQALKATGLLLKHQGFNVNQLDAQGKYPVDVAVEKNNHEVQDILIAAGASENRARLTAEQQMQLYRYLDPRDPNRIKNILENVYKQALSDGSLLSPEEFFSDLWRMGQALERSGIDLNACSNDGTFPLYRAALGGKLNIVRALCFGGASLDQVAVFTDDNKDAYSAPLFAAAIRGGFLRGDYSSALFLVNEGMPVNVEYKAPGWTSTVAGYLRTYAPADDEGVETILSFRALGFAVDQKTQSHEGA